MKTVLVAGDITQEDHLAQLPGALSSNYYPSGDTSMRQRAGGATHLAEIVKCATADMDEVAVNGPLARDTIDGNRTGMSIPFKVVYMWAPFPKILNSMQFVWRIRSFLGSPAQEEDTIVPNGDADTAEPDVLILNDFGLKFRHESVSWPRCLGRENINSEIVLKTVPPIGQGALWNELIRDHADRLTIVLSARSLRARQAPISEGLSWDRTIEDLDRELTSGPSANDLGRANRVIVYLRGAGVAIYQRQAGEQLSLQRFVYHPDYLEGDWHSNRPGLTVGATSILTASIARHLLGSNTYPMFTACARALEAIRANHEQGGGSVWKGEGGMQEALAPSSDYGASTNRLVKFFHPGVTKTSEQLPESRYRSAFPHKEFGLTQQHNSTGAVSDLLHDVTGPGYEFAAATAMRVVLHGIDQALGSAPKARYGKFITVDREEIEKINEIRRLIVSYTSNTSDRRPLSIAVFGPPGAGKSFAIKQLFGVVFGPSQAFLEFNLSQISGKAELHRTFDQVRDATIAGKIPLVFWDEFDSENLSWLKEFLAPMQDAGYDANGVRHPFGKAIFVFAGGTSPNFIAFNHSEARGKVGEQFRLAKGPDFVSRLRGYVNIKGPNPVGSPGQLRADISAADDVAHLIRRAILLRAIIQHLFPQLVADASGTTAISPSIIRAFLRVRRYRHGARSMEAVVGMSALSGARHFGSSELPAPDMLAMHVTPDFMQLVMEGELEESTIEYLAQEAHRAWMGERLAAGWKYEEFQSDEKKTHPLLIEYHQLKESDRERNRASARMTVAKLHYVGYRIIQPYPVGQERLVPAELDGDSRKGLMKLEHEIWLRSHLLEGYQFAERTNEDLRLHRDVTTFEGQPSQDKELNAALVDGMIQGLERGAYILAKAAGEWPTVKVGTTGHRTLTDLTPLREGILEGIQVIQKEYPGRPLILLSLLAEGADRIVAEAVLRTPDAKLVPVIPFEAEKYADQFGPPGAPSRIHYQALLSRSRDAIQLPDSVSMEEGYVAAAKTIVEESDVLMAVWDGQEAQGPGGTGHVIELAREKGMPIVTVFAGNRIPNSEEPTSLGEIQGTVIVENLG